MKNLDRDRALTFTGILLALFLGALDQTIVATALPLIVADLGGLERYAWVVTAYLLASTALVPIYGKLADMVSRRRIELVAVSLFLAGSFLCGIAGEFGTLPILGDGMTQLIIFRGIQGTGGAGLFAMTFIVIADLFPPAERGRYQGFVGATFAIASVLGPLVGGLLTDHAGGWIPGVEGWRFIFYVNLPFGMLALWFIVTHMPALEPYGQRARLSARSVVLLIAGLFALVLGLQLDKVRYPWLPGLSPPDAASPAWHGWVTPVLIAAAAVTLAAFVLRTRRDANPILDLGLFRNRVFTAANVASFFFGAAFLSVLFFLPLFVVNVIGLSATSAGVSLIPLSLGVASGAVVAGQIVSRVGHYRRLMLGGGSILFVGLALLATMSAETSYARVTLYMVVCGLGVGPSLPLYTLAIQNAVPVRLIGQATSAAQFFRQIGGTMGTAVLGTVLAVGLARGFATSPGDAPQVFAAAITRLYRYAMVFAAVGLLATLFVPELPLRTTHDRDVPDA